MKKLEIDFDKVIVAMEDPGRVRAWYIDSESGEVFSTPRSGTEAQDLGFDVVEIDSSPDRYVAIEPLPVPDTAADMKAFAETVADADLKARLLASIPHRNPLRRFNDALHAHPGERERWFRFREGRMHERIRVWFESRMGIEAVPRRPLL